MSLQMMYITNNPQIARIAEKYSVDRIWVDLEQIGKKERQGGMNTVQSTHTIEDVQVIRNSIEGKAKLQVRVNPIYDGSKAEIDKVLKYGADIIMLPFFQLRKRWCNLLIWWLVEQELVCFLRLWAQKKSGWNIGNPRH